MRKEHDRYSAASLSVGETDPRGNLFISPLGQVDLKNVHVLHSGLDTVRQLYSGNINPSVYDSISDLYESGFKQHFEILDYSFVISSGYSGGYRFILKNLELGIIILYGSRFVELEDSGSHLKIECSPHFLHERSILDVQKFLDRLSREFLISPLPCGIAVHLCADIQGWNVPDDFEKRLVTRSKRQYSINGIDSLSIDSNGIAAIHGARDSFTFGSASALQFCLYRKDKEAKARETIKKWEAVWITQTDDNFQPFYNPDLPVYRFEFRFHHNVIREFASFLGRSLNTLVQLSEHLTGLWRYATNTYRLDASRTYIDPFWQLLRDDIVIHCVSPAIHYKRSRPAPGIGNKRNVAAAIGNLVTIYAKHGYRALDAYDYLWSALGTEFISWQCDKQLDKSTMIQWLEKEMCTRRLLGKAAA